MSLASTQTAHREYANRPPDEHFASTDALLHAAQVDKQLSKEVTYNLRDLQIKTTQDPDDTTDGRADPRVSLHLQSPKGTARFTHWSFGQLCRTVGAPAAYLRDLPPAIAADALNYGLHDAAESGTSANILVRAANGHPEPTIRACTSDSYGRLWDADLYGSVSRQILSTDNRWTLPPTWTGEPAGAYRGDRDSFLIVTNGGSIVHDPSRSTDGDGTMYRGILIRNSEVGASSVVIETILFRAICGNHLLWGAVSDRTFRRRHFGSHVLRDTVREISAIAYRWAQQSTARDSAIIRAMIDTEIAHTKEAVIDELRALGATKEQAESAYVLCEQTEPASPRSYWGLTQGLTRLAQQQDYQDERYQLDRLGAELIKRAGALVRV